MVLVFFGGIFMKSVLDHKWLNARVKDITIEDAYCAWSDGVEFVCGDGKLKHITGSVARQFLGGKGVKQ